MNCNICNQDIFDKDLKWLSLLPTPKSEYVCRKITRSRRQWIKHIVADYSNKFALSNANAYLKIGEKISIKEIEKLILLK